MRSIAHHPPRFSSGGLVASRFAEHSLHTKDESDPRDRLESETWHGKGSMRFRAGLLISHDQNVEALDFVRQNYRQAGYSIPDSLAPAGVEHVIGAAKRHQKMIGTLSLWRDGSAGLQADEIYGDELSRLRGRGERLGELGRLAMDSRTPALTLLLSMVGKVVGAGCDRWHLTHLVIECNPRHVGFYTRALGFSVIGGERDCALVNAPAVLLHVSTGHLLHVTHQFGRVARIKNVRMDSVTASSERESYPRGASAIGPVMQGYPVAESPLPAPVHSLAPAFTSAFAGI